MKEYQASSMLVNREGEEIEVDIDGYIIYHIDLNYGADADGNRGVRRVFIDDVVKVSAYEDGEYFELTANEKDQAIDLLASEFLEG